jgi:hypothetical protein
MATEITWVPSLGGMTWKSNRTRDLVDVAFTIEKLNDGHIMVLVRCSKSDEDNSRAREVIGRVYFDSLEVAKSIVQALLNQANCELDRKSARNWLNQSLLNASIDVAPSGVKINPGVLIDGFWCNKPDLGMTTSTSLEVEDITPEALANPITETPSSGIYKVDLETDSWSPWSAISDDLEKAIAAKRASLAMKETIELIIEEATPVVEPEIKVEIPKFITINGKEIPITWPK